MTTKLLEPVRSFDELRALRRLSIELPDGSRVTENLVRWKMRNDEEFRESCTTRLGKPLLVHLPSLLSYIGGNRRGRHRQQVAA